MSRRFRFRLARVARVRGLEERIARGAWIAAEEQARRAEGAVEEARRSIADANGSLVGRMRAGGLEPRRVVLEQALVESMSRELRRRVEDARTLRFQADLARTAWQERRLEVRGLGQLEQRQRTRHTTEERRREAAAMDEVALMRGARVVRPEPAAVGEKDSSSGPRTVDEGSFAPDPAFPR